MRREDRLPWRIYAVLVAIVLLWTLVRMLVDVASAQPSQGFGPTFDATNSALRVNVVAGGASGGTSSNFGQGFPSTGTAAGGKDPSGAMASFTISNTGRLQVTCDNCSSSAATFGQTFPASGGPGGYKDALGSFASFTGVNGKQNVIVGNESTLIATANQGASATAANAWPFVTVSDGGVMVRPGDDTNKAIRVNMVASSVASGGTSSNFGTVFPSSGTAAGFKDGSGAMASATVDNTGKINVKVAADSTLIATVNQGTSPWNVRTTSDSTLTATVTQTTAANLNALVAQGASATANNGWPIVNVDDAGVMVRAGDATNKALRVNVVTALPAGTNIIGNVRTTSDSTLTATVTQGTSPWDVRTRSDSTLTATVTQTTAANLNALVAQGASASVANAWPVVQVDDAGLMVRPGDATNKALRVNIVASSVASGGTSSTFGTAFPTTGTAAGFKDPSGAMASISTTNRLPVTCDNCSSSAATFGTAFPSSGGPVGGKDANGAFASVTVTNSRLDVNGTLRNSASQELGANLPGANNVALVTTPQVTLPIPRPALTPAVGDAKAVIWGTGQMMAMLTDGTTSVKIAKPNIASAVTDPALVVTQSPMPSLQCPNTTAISQSASATLINGTAGKTTFICTLSINARDTAVRVSLIEGTGTNCGTGATALIGGTAASFGLSATGGFHGVSDRVTIPGKVSGNNVCLIQDAAVNVSGVITFGQY